MIPITQAVDIIYKDKQAAITQSGSKQHMPLSRNRKPAPKVDKNKVSMKDKKVAAFKIFKEDSENDYAIADMLAVSRSTVRRWREEYANV